MITQKKCKGNGVARGYGCYDMVPVSLYGKANRVYGLGKSCGCYSNWLRTSPEGKEKIQKATLKAAKPRKELEKASEETRQNKSLSALLINVRTVCHTYIKKRDYGKPCISCGEPWHKDFQAGHYYKAELFSTLKFNEHNIHGQCEGCNIRKEGNLSQYSVNLPIRIGNVPFSILNKLAKLDRQRSMFKWDRIKLNETREYYKKLLKQL
jgi:hypothetical protein